VCDSFKCLNHDEIVGSKICMSKDVDLSNMLFSDIHFAPFILRLLDEWTKSIQNT